VQQQVLRYAHRGNKDIVGLGLYLMRRFVADEAGAVQELGGCRRQHALRDKVIDSFL
jgi:hypothetical protein